MGREGQKYNQREDAESRSPTASAEMRQAGDSESRDSDKDRPFSLEECREYAEAGKLEEWIDEFLRAKGGNVTLAKGLRAKERYWLGPVILSLKEFRRICGPEEGMEYPEPAERWEKRVTGFVDIIRAGDSLPPIIILDRDEELVVADGNHRYEAFLREGLDEHWVIIAFNSEDGRESFESSRTHND